MLKVRILLFLPLLIGCARASVMPLAQDTVQISSHTAPVCGGAGAAQDVAFKRAAVETIRRGYDRFVIVGAEGQTEARVLGYTPTQATQPAPPPPRGMVIRRRRLAVQRPPLPAAHQSLPTPTIKI